MGRRTTMSRTSLIIIVFAIIVSKSTSLEQLCSIIGETLPHGQHLRYVDCARRDLEDIPDLKKLPSRITSLDISKNKIKHLTSNDTSATLKILNAHSNEISEISVEFMRNLPSLKRLDVSNNRILRLDYDVFSWNPGLYHLNLSYNYINKLPDSLFKNLKGLRHLDISYNYQLGVQIESYHNLLTSPLGFYKNLTTLNANYVNLTRIHRRLFENLALTSISLADNNLIELPLFPGTLEHLDLSGNHFKHIDAYHMNYINLKTLKLHRLYNLEDFEQHAFQNLQSLERLSIQNCPYLKHLDNSIFGRLVDEETWSMKEISLAENGLTNFDKTYYRLFSKVERVDLNGNPWFCDCNVLWFAKLNWSTWDNFRCDLPRNLRGKHIFSLFGKMPQCPRETDLHTVLPGGTDVHTVLLIIMIVLALVLVTIILYRIFCHKCGVSPSYSTAVIYADEEYY